VQLGIKMKLSKTGCGEVKSIQNRIKWLIIIIENKHNTSLTKIGDVSEG
jgi:hypothetical protein